MSQDDSPTGTQPTQPLVQTVAAPRGDEKVLVLSLAGVPQLLQQKVSSSLGCYRNNNASGTPHSLLGCLSSHMEPWVAPLGKEAMWVGTFGHSIPSLNSCHLISTHPHKARRLKQVQRGKARTQSHTASQVAAVSGS